MCVNMSHDLRERGNLYWLMAGPILEAVRLIKEFTRLSWFF